MGGCLWGLQTAPLSRLHNRAIEPIENIKDFSLLPRTYRCSEYEHFLLYLSSKKMKCFQKVGGPYFISVRLTRYFLAARRSQTRIPRNSGLQRQQLPLKSVACFWPWKGLWSLTECSENQDFLMIHKRLLTLPLWGVQSRCAGLCMGKVLQGKKNALFFP